MKIYLVSTTGYASSNNDAVTRALESAEDLIDELISASYESGYYALNQKELVSAAVTRRRNARRELERRLAPKSQDHITTEPKFVHSPGYPQDESEFSAAGGQLVGGRRRFPRSEIERLRTPEIPLPEA